MFMTVALSVCMGCCSSLKVITYSGIMDGSLTDFWWDAGTMTTGRGLIGWNKVVEKNGEMRGSKPKILN